MEVTLIVVTLLSIAIAIAMGILTWRLLQEERLRSDARVAALEQGLAETLQDAYVTQAAASSGAARSVAHANTQPSAATPSSATSSAEAAQSDLFAPDDTDWLSHFPSSTATPLSTTSRQAERTHETRIFAVSEGDGQADPADTLYASDRPDAPVVTSLAKEQPRETRIFAATEVGDLPDVVDTSYSNGRLHAARVADADAVDAADDPAAETVVNANGGLFGHIDADDRHVGWSRHALAVAAVAAVMIGAVIAFWTIGRLMEPTTDRAGTVAARAGAGANGAVTSALELMSLRQEMTDGTLTISGLVRNPRGGVPQERLTAVVFFFDGQGGFLSSTRAPLDYRALAPGEESPFQLSAPAPAGVARYRVSFRRDEGAVVPHVDRRQQVQQGLQGRPNQPQEASRL
jgi:type II secretory pathway pseudopilin PulG